MVSHIAGLAQEAVGDALRYAETQDPAIPEGLRSRVVQIETIRREVGNLAIEILARYQPVARDLRLVSSVMEVCYDYYRVARYAAEIVRTLSIAATPGCELPVTGRAGRTVAEMLAKATRAFLDADADLAMEAMRLDTEIDRVYVEALKALKGSEQVPLCQALEALVLRHLERIADHATYIASAAIYVATGERV